MVRQAINIPLIAAGGIASGRTMLAAEVLGANGVQIGSRFAVSEESSAHINYKQRVIHSTEGETALTLKQITPVRLIKNKFYLEVKAAEERGATKDELAFLLGKRRAKRGIFEGDLEEGELEIGQISASLRKIETVDEIIKDIMNEYRNLKSNFSA